MDPRAVTVLRLLAEIETGEEIVTTSSAGGRSETLTRQHAVVTDEEATARFLSVHLDESLATREPHESGWWTYRAGGFDPLPPWEAHARRRQAGRARRRRRLPGPPDSIA